VLAVFSLFEGFADVLLFWLPLYYEIKFFFVVWLQHPSTNGAQMIYNRYIRLFLVERQGAVLPSFFFFFLFWEGIYLIYIALSWDWRT
jgi:hypothetical protein